MDFPGTSPYKDQRNLLKMFAIDYKLSTPNISTVSPVSPQASMLKQKNRCRRNRVIRKEERAMRETKTCLFTVAA